MDSGNKTKAFFFDRDGIVNVRLVGDYVRKIEQFVFMEDFFELLIRVKKLGFLAILVTNQQGIGKGLMGESDLEEIHGFMQKTMFEKTGFNFDDIFYCPDLEESGSFRRKPNPGMIFEASEKWGINLS